MKCKSIYENNISGIVIYNIGNKQFFTDLDDIVSILKLTDDVKFYKIKNNIFLDLNFTLIPFINLNQFFNTNSKRKSINSRILVIESESQILALQVDKVSEIYIIKNDNLFENYLQINKTSCNDQFIRGKLLHEGKTLILPDYKNIINSLISNKKNNVQVQN